MTPAQLDALMARLLDEYDGCPGPVTTARVAILRDAHAAIAALRADAERYRWLRDNWACFVTDSDYPLPPNVGGTDFWAARDNVYDARHAEDLDAAIDEARSKG